MSPQTIGTTYTGRKCSVFCRGSSSAIDKRRESVDVIQKGFGEGEYVLCIIFTEILVFMYCRVPVDANFLSPICHCGSNFSIRCEGFEAFFKLPRRVHSFSCQVKSFATEQNRGFKFFPAKVVQRFLVSASNLLRYAVRYLLGSYFGILKPSTRYVAVRVIQVEHRSCRPRGFFKLGCRIRPYNDNLSAMGAYEGNPVVCPNPYDYITSHARFGRFAVWAINSCNVSSHFSFLCFTCLNATIIGCFAQALQVEKAKYD